MFKRTGLLCCYLSYFILELRYVIALPIINFLRIHGVCWCYRYLNMVKMHTEPVVSFSLLYFGGPMPFANIFSSSHFYGNTKAANVSHLFYFQFYGNTSVTYNSHTYRYHKKRIGEYSLLIFPTFFRLKTPSEDEIHLWPIFGYKNNEKFKEYSTIYPIVILRYQHDGGYQAKILYPLIYGNVTNKGFWSFL
jgi:hypothetical protein